MATDDKNLTIALPGFSEALLFGAPVEVAAFFERELALWTEFQTRVAASAPASARVRGVPAAVVKQWRNHLNSINHLIETQSAEALPEATRNALAVIAGEARERNLVVSTSQAGAGILHLAEHDLVAAAYLQAFHSGVELAATFGASDGATIIEFLRTLPKIISARDGEADFLAARAAENVTQTSAARDRIERIETEAESVLAVENERFAEFSTESLVLREAALKEAQEQAKVQRANIEEAWTSLRSTLFTAIKLRAPRTYWEEKAKKHRMAALGWGMGFVASLLLGIAMPVYVTPKLAQSINTISMGEAQRGVAPPAAGNSIQPATNMGIPTAATTSTQSLTLPPTLPAASPPVPSETGSWVLPLVSLGVPLFIALWLARMAARQVSEHLLRQQDALERSVMVETFLALNSQETGEALAGLEANFPVILQAIFRSGPGLNTDDSPPLGALDALVRSARGNKN